MTRFREFLVLYIFLVAYFGNIFAEESFSHCGDTRINWISSKEIESPYNEGTSEHIRLLKLNAIKHREENINILNHLQNSHIPQNTTQDNEHHDNNNIDEERQNEIDMVEKNKNHKNKRKIRKSVNRKSMNWENLEQIDNNDKSFVEVVKVIKKTDQKSHHKSHHKSHQKSHHKTHHKSKKLNDECEPDSSGLVGEDDISEFVNLIGEMNNKFVTETPAEQIENHPVSKDTFDEKHNSMHIYNNDKSTKDLYKKYKDEKKDSNMRMQQIESIEYVGAGYDIIFGNPSGDPFLKVDPGYRDSIIKLTYPKTDDDFPDKYKNKSPSGSYVRNEISCNRFEHEHEINTMSEYTHELSSDTAVNISFLGFSLFSASVGYKKTSKVFSKNKEKMFMLKSYCFQYVASLSNYGQWEFTDQFNRAVTMLPSYFNSLEHDGTTCKVSELRIDPNDDSCGASVREWLQFFKSFGTHVSTLLHLGGKITQITKASKSEFKSSKSSSVSSTVSSGFLGGVQTSNDSKTSNNKSSDSSSEEKETIIIGGKMIFDPNNPKDFEKWANSVRKYPMPIKGEYEPLSKILPTRLTDAYKEALEFYVTLYGSSPYGRGTMFVDVEKINLRKRLRETTLITSNDGPGIVSAKCPHNTRVIAGFVFSVPRALNVIDNLEMSTCKVDEQSCSSKTNDLDVYNNVFAICAENPLPFMDQQTVTQTTNSVTLRCENKNQIILWGFGFIFTEGEKKNKKLDIKSCKYGKNSCTIEAEGSEEENRLTHISGWIVCIHEDYSDTAHTTKVNSSVKTFDKKKNLVFQHFSTQCFPDLLFTIALTISEEQFGTRKTRCLQTEKQCSKHVEQCVPFKPHNAYYTVVVY